MKSRLQSICNKKIVNLFKNILRKYSLYCIYVNMINYNRRIFNINYDLSIINFLMIILLIKC